VHDTKMSFVMLPGRSEKPAEPAAPTSNGTSTPTGGHFVVQYPLTSFASTPHNVAAISFLLGSLWGVGLLLGSSLFTSKFLLWAPTAGGDDLPPQSVLGALRSPILGIYIASWALFHLLEFIVTSMYNPGKLSVSCWFPLSLL
jgi:hypothetical protein